MKNSDLSLYDRPHAYDKTQEKRINASQVTLENSYRRKNPFSNQRKVILSIDQDETLMGTILGRI
jgi:hypothetical protein